MSESEITPEDLAFVNAGYWTVLNKVKIQTGEFSFKNHEYQIEPMSCNARRKCYMKSAQTFGATEIETLTDLWGMIKGITPLGVAHVFPTADEVTSYGKTRLKTLIANNPSSIGKFVRDTDSADLKKVANAFFYLRGARLSGKVGDSDENTSSKTSAFSVDRIVFDEVDFMDSAVIEKFLGRMAHSKIKQEVYLGNPSHEDYGIDLIFKKSDQRYWFRKCGCGHWTCAEKSFPACVKIRPDGTGYIGCDKCGKELPIWAGEGSSEWVAEFSDKTDYMRGYLLSQLSTIYNDPAEILMDYTNPPNGNLADVYRLRLSRPYSNKSDKLSRSVVLQCCNNEMMSTAYSGGQAAMGVDVGKIKHVVIGIKTAKDRFELLYVGKVETFKDIYDLAKKFNVKSDVVDIRPYEDEARTYQKNSGHRTYLCEYSDTMLQDSIFNEDTGIVKANRTEMFDVTHKMFSEMRIKLPRQCPEIEEFARQCCNCAKFEDKDKRSGTIVFRYRPTGDQQEHYRNAMNYFYLAANGNKLPVTSESIRKNRNDTSDFNYKRL